jgi:putative drug exporter of the RND superfamily
MGLPFVAALGTAGAIVVTLAVLVALTLMPALLSLAGTRVDRWKVPFLHSTEGVDTSSGWYRLSTAIQRRPLPYFVGATALLLVLAAPVLTMRLGFTDAGNGSEDLHSRRAYDLLAKGFGPGYNGPLLGVADISNGGQQALVSIRDRIAAAPNVAYVSPPSVNPEGNTAVFVIVPLTSPQDQRTEKLVHNLRQKVVPPALEGTGIDFYLGGRTASGIDVGDRITGRLPFLFAGVIGLSFLLLMMVFRSILIPVKAAIVNLLSIGAAYGVIVAIFQWGWFAGFLGVGEGPIEVFLPMMLFAILFGLSMDYEVFLISRIREEYLRTGSNAIAVSNGLTATARVITAAAAIMVSVFLAFVLGPDRVIKEFGIGLATAIFVDATIVRLILVPSTMELLGDRNWWLPRWLDRLLPRINVEGDELQLLEPEPAGAAAGGS